MTAMKKYMFVIAVLIRISAYGQGSDEKIDPRLKGYWTGDKNCEMTAGSLFIGTANPVSMEINSNQINILAKIVRSSENIYNVFLTATEDLGSGGMKLPWKDFSRDKPIAQLVWSANKMKFVWIGFYNKRSGDYEWKQEPDWVSLDGFDGYFYKCD